MDGMLSQEEINALLNGVMDDTADSGAAPAEDNAAALDMNRGDILSDVEKDAIGEISNISMGTAATTLNALVGQPVSITTPTVAYSTWGDMAADFKARPCVALQLGYKEGLDGENVLILKDRDVMVITDLMMGGDGTHTDGELGELQLSAISEAMNQMMGSSSTSLSSMINKKVDILPPKATLVDFNDDIALTGSAFQMTEFVKVSFQMTIGDLVNSEIMQLYPLDFAKKLYDMFMEGALGGSDSSSSAPQPESQPAPQPAASAAPPPAAPMPNMGEGQGMGQMPGYGMPGMDMNQMQGMGQMPPGYGAPYQMPGYGMPPYGMPYPYPQQPAPQPNVNVQPAQFQGFASNVSPVQQKENIDLIMDVPLDVKVELGRTSKSIKDVLEFAPGTVIELNKIAGEPVDVLVNGKYVAKGEVVVLEENFAVRITEILDEKNKNNY